MRKNRYKQGKKDKREEEKIKTDIPCNYHLLEIQIVVFEEKNYT